MISVFSLDDILIILEVVKVFSNCLHGMENQTGKTNEATVTGAK